MIMLNYGQIREIKERLAERYTSMELVELLEIPVEYIIDEYWEWLLDKHSDLLEEVGFGEE